MALAHFDCIFIGNEKCEQLEGNINDFLVEVELQRIRTGDFFTSFL